MKAVEIQLTNYDIKQHAKTPVTSLSGGNKRKFVTAAVMLGYPDIAFLDESAAGVDPASRRKMWKAIKRDSKNTALITTTHSMEEAEALGTKIGIMVAGKFKCFGSSQHLKDKFGKGFEVIIKLNMDEINDSAEEIWNDAKKELSISNI